MIQQMCLSCGYCRPEEEHTTTGCLKCDKKRGIKSKPLPNKSPAVLRASNSPIDKPLR